MSGKPQRGALSLDDQRVIIVRWTQVLTRGHLTQHCADRQTFRLASELDILNDGASEDIEGIEEIFWNKISFLVVKRVQYGDLQAGWRFIVR